MKDVKSFVSQFILPEKNIDIDALRENIRNLKEMQLLFEEVQKQAAALETIRQTYDDILHIEEQILVIDILLKIAEAESIKEHKIEIKKQIGLEGQKKTQSENQSQRLAYDIEHLEECNDRVQAVLNSGQTALLLSTIQSEINSKKRDYTELTADIEKLKDHLNRIRSAERLLPIHLSDRKNNLSVLENERTDIQDKIDLVINLESLFADAAQSVQEQLLEATARQKALNDALSDLSREINSLKNNKITYDRNIIAFGNMNLRSSYLF